LPPFLAAAPHPRFDVPAKFDRPEDTTCQCDDLNHNGSGLASKCPFHYQTDEEGNQIFLRQRRARFIVLSAPYTRNAGGET
jgi:hypothetical protein